MNHSGGEITRPVTNRRPGDPENSVSRLIPVQVLVLELPLALLDLRLVAAGIPEALGQILAFRRVEKRTEDGCADH